MNELLLARWQFGITTVYHFFFVPLTIGLAVLVAIMETQYVRSGNEIYKRMAQFWGKLFTINFVMGVVTGIVQEFQFGLNWSDYSRFVGDIFGAPLAIEALLAFFLESTFLGLWIFGWDRMPKALHAATIWLVAAGSALSAFWILVANSFMQQPVGFVLRNGRAEMIDFFALISNPNVLLQYPHVLLSALTTAAFFVLGISAYRLVRPANDHDTFQRSFRLAAIVAVAGSVLLIPAGHAQTQHIVQTQPMKIAAAEALWNSEDPASFSLFTWGDEARRKDVFSIRIPAVLSLLAFNSPRGEVKGINNLQAEYAQQYGPGDYVPPVALTYWTFRIMVGAGMLLALAALLSVYLVIRGKVMQQPRFLRLLTFLMLLPYIANVSGWLMAEIGRQPWIVFGLMKTVEGVSPAVSGGMVLFSLLGFTFLYGALMATDVSLLVKYARAEPGLEQDLAMASAY